MVKKKVFYYKINVLARGSQIQQAHRLRAACRAPNNALTINYHNTSAKTPEKIAINMTRHAMHLRMAWVGGWATFRQIDGP